MDEDGFLEDDEDEVVPPLTDAEIANWASGLRPEGGPGVMQQQMRLFLGDEGYEKAKVQNEAASTLYLDRQRLLNAILGTLSLWGNLLGFVLFVASVAVLVKFIL